MCDPVSTHTRFYEWQWEVRGVRAYSPNSRLAGRKHPHPRPAAVCNLGAPGPLWPPGSCPCPSPQWGLSPVAGRSQVSPSSKKRRLDTCSVRGLVRRGKHCSVDWGFFYFTTPCSFMF